MTKYFLTCLLVSLGFSSNAQYAITAGDRTIEFDDLVSIYYNQRFLKPGIDNNKNNRFSIKDLQIDIEGRKANRWEARLKIDFADLVSNNSSGIIDPENPGLMAAYIIYKSHALDVELGYDKLPYSQGAMDDITSTPFWSRGRLNNGDLFSLRDIGLTLSKSFWNQRINAYAGVYSGLGEAIVSNGDNDASGNPEFIGRVDVSYPCRYRYKEIDENISPMPQIRAGINARYTNKTQPGNNTLPVGSDGAYGLRITDGKRLAYGFDLTAMWAGFSGQFEYQHLLLKPSSPSNPLYVNTDETKNKGEVNAGGISAQLSYHARALHSVLSARYDQVNLNDLVPGEIEWLSLGYAYCMEGWRSAFKIQYYKPLTEDEISDPLKWTDQVRIGWQYQF